MSRLLKRQIREDGACARCHQQGYVVSIDDLSAFNHQRNVGSASLDHRFPGRRHGQQRGKRGAFFTHAMVRQHNEFRRLGTGLLYVFLQFGERGLRALNSVLGGKGDADAFGVS